MRLVAFPWYLNTHFAKEAQGIKWKCWRLADVLMQQEQKESGGRYAVNKFKRPVTLKIAVLDNKRCNAAACCEKKGDTDTMLK
ncbi:hypothetical protein E2C01_077836 [Portunus trituberculatus]|uniref:Uncharacterized protein n=1 Tax=Portunus trituberculatus TaxID=210409 RepID=A0A5B7ICG1_PORTR|nr:hypothetical protein [Portunus trituberculatus]